MKCTVNHVSKYIKDTCVLDDVSLSVESGEIVGIVGTNGSGKTMLLRAIAGLILPEEGTISIETKSAHSIGVIIEDSGFQKDLTGYENLKFLADINHKIDDNRIEEVLEQFGLEKKKDKKVKTYSLGMKKKLSIAQAVMEYPELLLLDEPFNALDEQTVITVKEYLKEYVQANDAGILLVSHHQEDIHDLCNRVYSMEEGCLR